MISLKFLLLHTFLSESPQSLIHNSSFLPLQRIPFPFLPPGNKFSYSIHLLKIAREKKLFKRKKKKSFSLSNRIHLTYTTCLLCFNYLFIYLFHVQERQREKQQLQQGLDAMFQAQSSACPSHRGRCPAHPLTSTWEASDVGLPGRALYTVCYCCAIVWPQVNFSNHPLTSPQHSLLCNLIYFIYKIKIYRILYILYSKK